MGNVPSRTWRRQSRLAAVLLFIYIAHKIFGRSILLLLIRRYWGEKPRLVYHATTKNKTLLAQCPALTTEQYYPSWRLFNGHLQTIRLALDNRAPKIKYTRQLLSLPDGGVVSLDWALRHDQVTSDQDAQVEPTRRTVLLLPGLTGGSHDKYIRCTVAQLYQVGWQCVVLNARGCANTPLLTAHLFSCAFTADLRFVLHELSTQYNFESFVGVGFSMGSNVLVKYLGEEGDQTPLTAGVSIGNPFDLAICSANFGNSLMNRFTYDMVLNYSLRDLFFNKTNAAQQFQNHPQIDLEKIQTSRTVREFDDALTAPVFGYQSADDYYADGGSIHKLGQVRIPLLCLSTEDDPICIRAAWPSDDQVVANQHLIFATTKSGGHLAYYESAVIEQRADVTMWVTRPIAEFAEAARYKKRNDL